MTAVDDGALVLDKPAGLTSARALDPVKRAAGKLKVGHAGTLDPFATGVLVALVGDATRLADLVMRMPKTYRTTVRFGVGTDTLDPEGVVVASCDPGEPRALPLDRFLGTIEQVPPAHSALKVNGRRAYLLARAGETPALAARTVTVHSIEVRRVAWPDVELDVVCGAGTYIRALARDLGAAVGLPAHVAALRRTRIGPLEPGPSLVAPLDLACAAGIPVLDLAPDAARAFAQGRVVRCEASGRVAVACGGRLVGLGDGEQGRLHARTVLSSARAALEGRVP